MRIGTWNLAGRWTPDHEVFLLDQDCDLWLLTEVNERTELPGFVGHTTAARMAPRRRWAGVFSRVGLEPLPDPHPASAMASVNALTFCSSILPWKGAGDRKPWIGSTHAERTAAALNELLRALPTANLVWGGDWNHALRGPEYAGGKAGRGYILESLKALGLTVPTEDLPHRIDGLLSIDHIAVPEDRPVAHRERVVAAVETRRLSDHDGYVIAVTR